jgi:hypothetical protein
MKMTAKKNLMAAVALVFLLAGVAMADDDGGSTPNIYYASEEELLRATSDYLLLYSFAVTSDDSFAIMVVLDNPDTPEVGDAIAVFRMGELAEFWQLIDGNLRKVFDADSQVGLYI